MSCYTEINIIKQDVEDNLVTLEDYGKCDFDCSMISHLSVISGYVDRYVKITLDAVSKSGDSDRIHEVNKKFLRDYLIYNLALFEDYYEFHDISNDKGIIHFAVLKREGKYFTKRYSVDNHKLKIAEVEFLDDLVMSLCVGFLIEYNGIYLKDYNHFELDKKNLAIISEKLVYHIKDFAYTVDDDIATSIYFRGMSTVVEVVDRLTYNFYSYEEEVVSIDDPYEYYMGDW